MLRSLLAAGLGIVLAAAAPSAIAAEAPKHGGTLTYMIAADAPPSLDGHREQTYATVHATAPFYSVLIRINPENPGSATDFVCDLCTEIPQPTDGGRTYTFKIRQGVKFHDGTPLTAADVAASWNAIIHPPWRFAQATITSGNQLIAQLDPARYRCSQWSSRQASAKVTI